MASFEQRLTPSIDVSMVEEPPSTPRRDRSTAHFELSAALPPDFESESAYAQTRLGMNLSWAGNIILLVAKVLAYALSGSYAVLASLIDSVVDLLSQVLVALAERANQRWHPSYPTGRSRLETVAVLGTACIMVTATVLIIRESIQGLEEGVGGNLPHLDLGPVVYCVLGLATLVKLGLWLYCRRISHLTPAMLAITEDHWNDIVMNVAALIFPIIAFYVPKVWWIDPAGGILISCYILWRWYEISLEQVRNIVGIIAPEEFILQVEGIVSSHNSLMAMDKVTAYHFGQRYVCEIEVVMHPDTTLQVSHDVAMDLQHKVEGLANVERAFVHVDYSKRDYLEHKVERALQLKERSTTSPTASLSAQADTNTGLRHRGTEAL